MASVSSEAYEAGRGSTTSSRRLRVHHRGLPASRRRAIQAGRGTDLARRAGSHHPGLRQQAWTPPEPVASATGEMRATVGRERITRAASKLASMRAKRATQPSSNCVAIRRTSASVACASPARSRCDRAAARVRRTRAFRLNPPTSAEGASPGARAEGARRYPSNKGEVRDPVGAESEAESRA